jgi:DNA modification methylase
MLANHIYEGDAAVVLKEFPSESVDCVVTSPPYWAVRDYHVPEQIGMEKSIEAYLTKLMVVFNIVKRVLKRNGSCWVVMGDTYNSGGTGNLRNKGVSRMPVGNRSRPADKSLGLIPERFAIRMVEHGWILRNKIVWHKPNCMPSSAKDRFTIDYENVFFFTKSQKYYFETQYEPHANNHSIYVGGGPSIGGKKHTEEHGEAYSGKTWMPDGKGRIKRTVWKIPTSQNHDEHFAVFPEKLIETPIRAGCPIDGTVLDPFFGSGTTGIVALKNARNFVGVELNPDYCQLAKIRLMPWEGQKQLIAEEATTTTTKQTRLA